MNLLERMKRKRKKLRWSQERLARELGFSVGMIRRCEKNTDTSPYYLYQARIEEWLDEDLK